MLKAQVLQFAVGLVEPQTVRDRRINLKGFAADGFPSCAGHGFHGAHVVRAVSEFDQNHSHVSRHGQQHFAKRFNLSFLLRVKTEFVEFCQTVYKFSHGGAKFLQQIRFGDAAIFHHIVQQGRHQCLAVQFPFCALQRHCNWVGDVGFPATSGHT